MKRIVAVACVGLALLACGAVYGAAPKFKTLHRFGVASGDGAGPTNVLVGEHSVLYGATVGGGTVGRGTVFSLAPPASPSGKWTETILYRFAGGTDGEEPGTVVIGKAGVLYGLSSYGGNASGYGCGTVFSLTSPSKSGGAWEENVLYRFLGGNDGCYPRGELSIDSGGVLYGATDNGGGPDCGGSGCGTVFSLTPPAVPGGSWIEAVLYSFGAANADRSPAQDGVVVGSDGILYGATGAGGDGGPGCGGFGCGMVFSLTPPSSPGGAWIPAVIHSFTGGADGDGPTGPLVIGPGGVLYGTLFGGGSLGGGAVFTLTPPASPGNPWTEAALFNFGVFNSGGTSPSNILLDGDGTIYGTTEHGGSSDCKGGGGAGCGVVFSLAPPAAPGGAWTEAVLYTFGVGPAPGPLVLKRGVLYGVDGYRTGQAFSLRP